MPRVKTKEGKIVEFSHNKKGEAAAARLAKKEGTRVIGRKAKKKKPRIIGMKTRRKYGEKAMGK